MIGGNGRSSAPEDRSAGWSLADVTRAVRDGGDRLTAWCLGALLGAGAALGAVNLLIDGVLRSGGYRVAYAATMLLLVLLGLTLAVRRRAGPQTAALLVVVGDAVYIVVAVTTTRPMLFAPPLLLLFCCVAAAWFLGPRMLTVHMLLVVVACGTALWHSFDNAVLVVQVAVSAAVLDLTTLGIFVLRRRVQRLLAHTQALSSTDPLTGLANRRWLVEQAPRMWRQARRDGQRVAALVLDLDHFKRLNDAFGHAAGDEVLRTVATSLSATVRPTDVLARTGGEELVVLGLVSDPGEARQLAERLRVAVRTSCAARQVTASIGVALVRPTDGEVATDGLWRLVDRADVAMYAAKQGGRDRVALAAGASVPRQRDRGPGTAWPPPGRHHPPAADRSER
jgi:diguanylate cyclase (GGDEF)-like protein